MTVLVTGGAGYIGSHMVLALNDAGERVVTLDNLSTGFDWAVAQPARLVVGDVGDQALVAALIKEQGVDTIVHFAASVVVPESVSDPLRYYRNNTVNSRALIECAVKGGVKHFIFSSTAAVYGNPARVPVDEDAAPVPMSPYGSSKLMTETMLRDAAAAHGLGYVILRYFNVAGADPKLRAGQSTRGATHLIKVAVETAAGARDHIDVFGTDYPTPDGTCVRDYIHVGDLIAAHSQALRYLRDGGRTEIYNCGYSHGYSVLEVIEKVRQVSGSKFEARIAPRRAGDSPILVAASGKIRKALDWRPQYDDLEAIVGQALAWERKLLGQD